MARLIGALHLSLLRFFYLGSLVFAAVVPDGAAAAAIVHGRHGHTDVPEFVATRHLPDGEREIWLHIGGVTAKETAVLGPDGGTKQQGIRLWQVTDGRHFIQSIYDINRELVDCEYVREEESVENFLDTFDEMFASARVLAEDGVTAGTLPGGVGGGGGGFASGRNESLRLLRGTTTTDASLEREEFGHVVDYSRLRNECKNLHRRIKLLAKEQRHKGKSSRDNELSRLKRDIFIYPGTNWCGIGSSTEKFNELGFNSAADRCCRQHDYCAHIIEGFSSKYNLFNYRFHTISHCDCDERFRTCLKIVNNAAANMVGKLFFNIVQMRCFVLKNEKKCSKRSWWGRCLKKETQKTAHLRDAIPF